VTPGGRGANFCRRDIISGSHVFKAVARKTMEIRRIRADEGLRLRALRLRALGDTPTAYGSTLASEESYPEAIWHERAASGAAGDKVVTIVAEHDNRLLGMATGLPADSATHDELNPTMVGVFVDGTVRQQGVGAGLVEKVIDWAKSRGSARLFVWITSGNEPAIALYRRCGFRVTGATRPNAHTSTLLEYEMLLDL
jgi:GNAT superfamily N-acetyltransferase